MAACNRCGGLMKYVPEKNMLKCEFCGNEEPLEQIINVENLNVSNDGMDADKMFENWLATTNPEAKSKLEQDFAYRYATDSRNQFIQSRKACATDFSVAKLDKYESLINEVLVGERFGKYRIQELAYIEKYKNIAIVMDMKKAEHEEWKRQNPEKAKRLEEKMLRQKIIDALRKNW